MSKEWVRRAIEKAYTQDEWIHRFKTELEFKDQFDALLKVQPKEIKADSVNTFRLVIEGIVNNAIQGHVIPELPEHEDEPVETVE